jgi:hypothetical protein
LSSAGPALDLHFGETTISIPFENTRALDLKESIEQLIETFSEKQKAERPKRWPSMEYRYKGKVFLSGSIMKDPAFLSSPCNNN